MLDCSGVIKIVGLTPGSTLTLKVQSNKQPCIGPRTVTGLSRGMWKRSSDRFKEIVIENCKVICEPTNLSFSLGTYGDEDVEYDIVPFDITTEQMLTPEQKK